MPVLALPSGRVTYPKDHRPGMRVPRGGSSCSNCRHLSPDHKHCRQEDFIQWRGSDLLPAPDDEYCSDWWERALGA